jgi:hypothetical protein
MTPGQGVARVQGMPAAWDPCPTHASQQQPCRECALDALATLARVNELRDAWQAEVEDDGDGLTPLGDVLDELTKALRGPSA